jgi:alpha-glucosidase (family GH31 glycosyl hydrolase)
MVAPIVYQNANHREVYFPGENEEWYQFEINIVSG